MVDAVQVGGDPAHAARWCEAYAFEVRPAHLPLKKLFDGVRSLFSTKTLDLKLEDIVELRGHLRHFTNLQQLVINASMGPEGITALAPSLCSLSALQWLDVSGNELCNEGAAALAPHLDCLTSLSTLRIHNNSVGDRGCAALGPHIAKLTGLVQLCLHNNCLGNGVAKGLAPHLLSLRRLKRLDLSSNGISDGPAESLACQLAKLVTVRGWPLQSVNLSANRIGAMGRRNVRSRLCTVQNMLVENQKSLF